MIVHGGDLVVNVSKDDTEGIRYQVPSTVLWTVSKVFRASFGPESDFETAMQLRNSGSATITLDDDAEAMGIALQLLCYWLKSLPKSVDFETIHAIAAIADKYGLEKALAPGLVAHWLGNPGDKPLEFGITCRWLFISWVFSYDDIFQEMASSITLHERECLDDILGVPQVLISTF